MDTRGLSDRTSSLLYRNGSTQAYNISLKSLEIVAALLEDVQSQVSIKHQTQFAVPNLEATYFKKIYTLVRLFLWNA